MTMHEYRLWHLPEAPGTVIAIGKWWLVRLEPHNGSGPGCWELLPARDEETSRSMKRAGVKDQCVYGDDWVLAEAEQEGGYLVVATAEKTWYGPTMRNVFPKAQERAHADPLHCTCVVVGTHSLGNKSDHACARCGQTWPVNSVPPACKSVDADPKDFFRLGIYTRCERCIY